MPASPSRGQGYVIDQALLQVDGVTVRFGGIVALDDVSFAVQSGHIVGFIGPNGAGKTTMFNCLSRLYGFSEGRIRFEGRSLLETPPHGIASLGIGRTFQNLALFRSMSVRQNIMLGAHCRTRTGYLANAFRLPSVRREEAGLAAKAARLIELLELGPVADKAVMDLSFGTQKRVELGRALASEPKLLLLDEPAGGLNHEEVEALMELLRRIRDELALTMLLVEHHMNMVMRISDRVVALDFGRKIADGT
ncbi:MAG: ABC transporter ATP-binding protein, partial [Caldimonas sp.]